MTRVVGLTRDELKTREEVFEGLTAKAVKMTTRAVTANLNKILTAAPTLSTAEEQVVTSTWNSYVAAELFPYLVQTFVDSAGDVYSKIDDLTDDDIPKVDTDFALQYLRRANNRLKGISNVIWSNMQEQLAEGYDAGETTLQLAARLRTVASISEPRALMIARTELVPAANFASLHQVQLAGFTDDECQKGWLSTEDSRTRPEHHAADGQRVGLSQPFTVGGEKMNFPGDWSLGATADNVINCRCSIEFVFDDDEVDTAGAWRDHQHPRDRTGKFTDKPFEILPESQRGKSGDGMYAPGMWGRYGAAGLMMRHVDEKGTARYLTVQRANPGGNQWKWQLPGGAIEELETPSQGAAREVFEEVGFSQEQLNELTPRGIHAIERPVEGKDPWKYSNVTADAPEMWQPRVDRKEGELWKALWLTEDQLREMAGRDRLVAPFAANLDKILAKFDEIPEVDMPTTAAFGFQVTNVTKTSPKSSYNVHMVTAAGKHNLPDPDWDESKVKRDNKGKFAKKAGSKLPDFPMMQHSKIEEWLNNLSQAHFDTLSQSDKTKLKSFVKGDPDYKTKISFFEKKFKEATKKAAPKTVNPNAKINPYAKNVEKLTPAAVKKAAAMFAPKSVGTGQVAAPPKPLHINTNVIYKQKYADGAVVAEKDNVGGIGKSRLVWDSSSKKFVLQKLHPKTGDWETDQSYGKGDAYKKFSKETGWHEPTPDVAPITAPAPALMEKIKSLSPVVANSDAHVNTLMSHVQSAAVGDVIAESHTSTGVEVRVTKTGINEYTAEIKLKGVWNGVTALNKDELKTYFLQGVNKWTPKSRAMASTTPLVTLPDFTEDDDYEVAKWYESLTQDQYDSLTPSEQIIAKQNAKYYDPNAQGTPFSKKLDQFDAAADEDFNPSSTYTPSAADLAKVQIGYEVDDDGESFDPAYVSGQPVLTNADEDTIANIDSMDPATFNAWFADYAHDKDQWDALSPGVQNHVRVTAEALAGFFGIMGPKNTIASHDSQSMTTPTPSPPPVGTVLKSMDDMNKDEFESWFFKNFAFDKSMWDASSQESKNKITKKAHDVGDKNTLQLIKSWLVQDMTPDQWNSFTPTQQAEIEDDIPELETTGLLENSDLLKFLKMKKVAKQSGGGKSSGGSATVGPLIELDWDNTSGPDGLTPVMYNGDPIVYAKSATDGSAAYLYRIDSNGDQGSYVGSVDYSKNETIDDKITTLIVTNKIVLPGSTITTPATPPPPTPGPGVSQFHVQVHHAIMPISAIGQPHQTSPDTQFHTLTPTDAVNMQNYMLSSNGKALSAHQVAAVQRYTTSIGYRSTNAVLRNDESQLKLLSDTDKKAGVKNAVDLQDVMTPLTQNVQVFRGTGAHAFGQKSIKANFKQLKALEGTTLTDKGFISTTVLENPPVSYDYAKKPIQMIVDVPAGSPGVYVSAVTPGWSQENELILGAGSSYRIKEVREATPEDKIRFGNSGLEHVVHVEIVPTTANSSSPITSPADAGKTPKPPSLSPAASAINVTVHPPGAIKTYTPMKITTTIIHKNKYQHGAVVAFKPASTVGGVPTLATRIVWNANNKKFVTQLDIDNSGNWQVGSAFSKKDAYAKFGPQTGWMAPQPNESALGTQGFNPPLTPKISNSASTPIAAPAATTPAAKKTPPLDAATLQSLYGNIPIGMSVMKQRMLFDAFKKESSAGFVSLNTTTDNIFRALKETLDKHNLHPGTAPDQQINLLQLLRIVDSESTSKANFLDVSKGGKGGLKNENFYEKKIVDWLQTPDGKDTANLIWSGSKDSDTVQDLIDNFLKPSAIGVSATNVTKFANLNHGTATLMQKQMESTYGAPSKPQLQAVGDYTGSGYGSINGVLRQDMTSSYKNMSEYTKKERLQVAATIQSAMKPIPKSITVYRGTGPDQFPGLSKYAKFDDIKKFEGQLFVDRGFVSTSVDVGKSFSGVKLTIEVPEGTPAWYVDNVSSASGEHELLLAAGTKFRVKSVIQDYGGIKVVLVVEP